MSLKEETQLQKMGGADLKFERLKLMVLRSMPVNKRKKKEKKKKKKQSDGALCFNTCLPSCRFYHMA